MKVLVTGGAGFIGSNLVKQLQQAGHAVTVLDNLLSGYQKNIATLNVNFIVGDIRDASILDRAASGAEVIYHLAASVGNKRSIDYPLIDADINVMGTLQVLEAARRHSVRKVVLSSSAGIFGELKTLPIDEQHAAEPRTPYASSKLYAEKVSLAYHDLYGIEVVCLRYFNVYGPHQRFDAYGNVIPIFVFKLLRDEPLTVYGDGEQTRDFVSVHDVVQANMKAGHARGVSGAFNIASGTRVTINELIRALSRASNQKPVVKHEGSRAGDVRDSLANIKAAQRAFAYQPTVDLQTGLAEYVAWAKTEIAESVT